MPEPHPHAYERYREGVLTRHVLCSGRYVEYLWLREFGIDDPPAYRRRNQRIAQIPEIVGAWTDKLTFTDPVARSPDGPCLYATNNHLFLLWCGAGSERRLQWTTSTDGVTWNPKVIIDGERSEHTPALAEFKGRWYIAWTGTDSDHHLNVMSSTDMTNWSGKQTFRSNPEARSNDGPRLVVANNALCLVWAGAGPQRRLQFTWTGDGTNWNPKTIIAAQRSDQTPGFAWFKGKLYIAWTGTDDEHHVNMMESNDAGATWRNKRTFITDPRRARSEDGPWLFATDDRMYLGWSGRGEYRRLQWMSTDDAITWQPKQIIGEKSARSPAFASFKDCFYVAWRGEDDDHHLNTMRGRVLQPAHARRYVPWTSNRRVLYGGGDNPLLRGGILMSTLAIEYMIQNARSSLAFATLMLKYWERCEVRDASGAQTGFFMRHRTPTYTAELEQNVSADEVVGMLMGLFYVYLATETKAPEVAARIRALTHRLGANLKQSAFVLIRPDVPTLKANRLHLQRGSTGLVFFQWALQQAFQRITGNPYRPSAANYTAASKRLWQVYQAEKDRLAAEDNDTLNELLGTMYIWSLQERHPEDLDEHWREAFENQHGVDFAHGAGLAIGAALFGPIGALAWELLWQVINISEDLWANQSPRTMYKTVLNMYKKAVYFAPGSFSWFNLTLAEHTLHYGLHANTNDTVDIAKEARSLLETMLGDRLVNHPDDDFYAAVIAKGLIAEHVSVDFMKRVNEAIEAREQLWENLPLTEPPLVRSGDWSNPVKWHNSAESAQATARMGGDFLWEHAEGKRIFSIDSVRGHITGMTDDLFQRVTGPLRGGAFEAGGLDYLFPRALMALWLGDSLTFMEKPLTPLHALTGVPFSENGHFRRASCDCRQDDLLLLGTPLY